ncbi:MAG: hypothetical protein M1820_004243 [Bogoriella megaspora]|nr:MAG: hypothetical protein M1820_004243 [Bogoriella megaspora]
MAPIRPASQRRTATSNSREHIHRPLKPSSSAFASSKKDKRLIKHSTLVNKIQKQHAKPSIKKRRRPNKKLVTTLESLADALPDDDVSEKPVSAAENQAEVRRKALKSRPGVQKRKEKVDKVERERFSQNLAQIIGSGATGDSQQLNESGIGIVKPNNRWEVLREFIKGNMEKG